MPDRKAPPGDRIKGSDSNSPKSSESTSSARSIEFSKSTEAALRSKVEKNNEGASAGRRTSLATLKAVYRRGAGAYSTSHRPGMTRNQWAMARVNAYLHLLKSGTPENKAYVSDNDLLPSGHPRSRRRKEMSGMVAAGEKCPVATQDIAKNLANRQRAIEAANYGPMNPSEPNDQFWQDKADIWDITPVEAKKSLCGNCAAFIKTPSMLDCIASGLEAGDANPQNAWDTIGAGDLGYCEAFDFKCASARTCDAWIAGGPVTEEKSTSMSVKDARMVSFGDATEAAIAARVFEYNAKAPKGFEVSIPTARAVFRRGALAMTASGTNRRTRNDWGFARLDAFLSLVRSGRPGNPSYTEDADLVPLTASMVRSEENAAGTVRGEESDLANALLDIAQKYGKFNQDETGIWAGYVPAAENEVADIGVMCANCVLYRGEDQCAIIALPVEPAGRCRFAVIPDGVVKPEPPIEDEVRAIPELLTFIKDQEDYESDEEAILDMTERSGLGYDAEPAIRAAWIRGIKDGSDPFKRALSMAELTDQSIDADLLPRAQKGVQQ